MGYTMVCKWTCSCGRKGQFSMINGEDDVGMMRKLLIVHREDRGCTVTTEMHRIEHPIIDMKWARAGESEAEAKA
jgi:hypothetical protein